MEIDKKLDLHYIGITNHNKHLSDTFAKALVNDIKVQLESMIGMKFNHKDFFIRTVGYPVEHSSNIRKFKEIGISYTPESQTRYWGALYYSTKDGDKVPPNYDELIKPGELKFWIDEISDFQMKGLMDHIEKRERMRGKKFVEKNKFLIEIKQASLNIEFKLIFEEKASVEFKEKVIDFISHSKEIYNTNSVNEIEGYFGIFHSIGLPNPVLRPSTNLILTFDLGSSADIGLEYIFKCLDESDFAIKKIEIKGV